MYKFLGVTAKALSVLALLAAGTATAAAQSVLSVRDTGTGESRLFTTADSAFSLSGDKHAVRFTAGITSPSAAMASWWEVKLEAPEGEVLRPGRFLDAGCPGRFRTGRAPGMEVTENNPRCRGDFDTLYGTYVIRQISFDEAGQVTAIDASFVQREGSKTAPALAGTFRYNTKPLSFEVSSDPGFVWGEIDQRNFSDTSFFSLEGTTAGIDYDASVYKDQWKIMIDPPTGQQLRVGRYRTRQEASGSEAAMRIVRGIGPQGGCYDPVGTLDIRTLETDAVGVVLKINATFEYRCEGTGPALRGQIRHRM